ncbi:hypothetical protein ACSBR1_008400 [Camellia fascicularis]
MFNLSLPSPPKLLSPSNKTINPSHHNTSSSSTQTLKHPNLEPFEDRLIRLANQGHLHQAISTLDLMTQQGLSPDLVTYSVLLKSCIRTRQFDLGKLVHSKLSHSLLDPDSVLLNSLITLYSKSGDWVTANSIFNGMGEHRDMVSWSAMISCFAHNGVFELQECLDWEDNFWGCGDLGSAKKVFDIMPERNAVTWTLMITRYSQLGQPKDAIELFIDMVASGFIPDRFTFSSTISACAELELLSLGQQLHSLVVKSRLILDVCVGCSLVDMYVKCAIDGSMVNSRKVFDRMPDHNVTCWTATITRYVQSGGHDKEAIELYCRMIKAAGEQIYTNAVKHGLASVNCVGNSLISMYARSGRMEDARKAFDILFEKNLVSYNTIVDGYAKNLDSNEAFELFNEIEDTGIEVDAFTYASLLSGAASIGAVGKGEQIHARNIEAALQVFTDIEDHTVISWTSIVRGLAKHGFATGALKMFQEMLKTGIKPNEVTYIAVLSACSHVGMINEGWKHFNAMYEEHGISPRMEHYACMVDLLGRSGFLEEAIQFINLMPFMADALVWRTLLGACQGYSNTEVGKHAAKMIIKQEPNDPAAYILLSNLYASSGQLDEVVRIRKNMKERNLVKEAGCSWIVTENRVYKFHVGDTSHPQAREIYEELDQLSFKIKELGYVPNTNFVLHDVEEEQKEQYLFQHSEKIAVAFGLISTSKSKPIRVFKNLRVCGDCHTAMKYISIATGREIVLRDSNKFHHFKGGACSCNDYW